MNNKFSENLKKIRKDNNLSQEQLADELGVSRQAISKWESAVAYPEMDKIITLCEKFNLNIDDLLHKDIREVKGEEESKKKLNKYVDDFLNFITNTINMFSNMSFKSKCKCIFEQIVIGSVLLSVCLIIGSIGQDLLFGIFGVIPDKLYYIIKSIFQLLYRIFAIMSLVVIMVHIFKTRYLDYYEKIKKDVVAEKTIDDNKILEDLDKEEKIDKKNKIFFKNNEDKIIIRDPKHSEYKFINGLFKGIVSIIKFCTLCFSILLFVSLICLFCGFVISFLAYKTGFFFIGVIIALLSVATINIVLILLLLNFVFNRKNDKKKMIWSFVISLIMLGIGSGLFLIGTLNFDYIEKDKNILKTEYIELDMREDIMFGVYPEIEYIESSNNNIKIEYTINKYCDIQHSNLSDSLIHIWAECSNPIKLIKEVIDNFNDRKIIPINNELQNVKIYTTKENIELLKNNYNKYNNEIETRQNLINSYESKINELEYQIDRYSEKVFEYEEKINNLEEKLFVYENE